MTATEGTAEVAPLRPDDSAERAAIEELLGRAERSTGLPPLAEASRLVWAAPDGAPRGLVRRSGDRVLGYAQLGERDGSFTIEIVVDPDDPDPSTRRRLLEAAVAAADRAGAHEIRSWDFGHRHDDPAVAELGFAHERDLLQMRVPLPLGIERQPTPDGLTLRAFRPGADEERWLEVNNRAFAAHPEQGHWELGDLLAREETEWFDPKGFILCEDGRQLAASCWTKVHARHSPPLGEIYVISVNPDYQGRGLGRLLTVAGLDWLAERVPMGMLYVDASNEAAVHLYRSLGFVVDHVDRSYLRTR